MTRPEGALLVPPSEAELERAAHLIASGAVVAIPTETCYGLAANALDEKAVTRVVEIKGRALTSPIAVIIANMQMLGLVAKPLSAAHLVLVKRHWPGALTLILPAIAGLAAPLLNAQGGIGVRISSDPIATRLAELVGCPLTATSANLSGQSPAIDARAALLPGVACAIDGGRRDGVPSTVAELGPGGTLRVLRAGAVPL